MTHDERQITEQHGAQKSISLVVCNIIYCIAYSSLHTLVRVCSVDVLIYHSQNQSKALVIAVTEICPLCVFATNSR